MRGLARRGSLDEMVPAQAYERVVQLTTPMSRGAGFTIDVKGRQWLVTARHVVEGARPDQVIVLRRAVRANVELTPVPPAEVGADIAVFELSQDITPPNLTLHATSGGVIFSQDAYFLGWPYGLGLRDARFGAYPFVKKSIVAGLDEDVNGVSLFLLDGINNPGFSGGPVVFNKIGTKDWHVMSVVSAYRTEQISVVGGTGAVPANTGIVITYDIRHAVDSIEQYMT